MEELFGLTRNNNENENDEEYRSLSIVDGGSTEDAEYRSLCLSIVDGGSTEDAAAWRRILELASSKQPTQLSIADLLRLHRRATCRFPDDEIIWKYYAQAQILAGAKKEAKLTLLHLTNMQKQRDDHALDDDIESLLAQVRDPTQDQGEEDEHTLRVDNHHRPSLIKAPVPTSASKNDTDLSELLYAKSNYLAQKYSSPFPTKTLALEHSISATKSTNLLAATSMHDKATPLRISTAKNKTQSNTCTSSCEGTPNLLSQQGHGLSTTSHRLPFFNSKLPHLSSLSWNPQPIPEHASQTMDSNTAIGICKNSSHSPDKEQKAPTLSKLDLGYMLEWDPLKHRQQLQSKSTSTSDVAAPVTASKQQEPSPLTVTEESLASQRDAVTSAYAITTNSDEDTNAMPKKLTLSRNEISYMLQWNPESYRKTTSNANPSETPIAATRQSSLNKQECSAPDHLELPHVAEHPDKTIVDENDADCNKRKSLQDKDHPIPHVADQASNTIEKENSAANIKRKRLQDEDQPLPRVVEQLSITTKTQNCTANSKRKILQDKDQPSPPMPNQPSIIEKEKNVDIIKRESPQDKDQPLPDIADQPSVSIRIEKSVAGTKRKVLQDKDQPPAKQSRSQSLQPPFSSVTSLSSGSNNNDVSFNSDSNLLAKLNRDFLPLAQQSNMLTVNGNSYAKLGVIGKGGSCKVYRALSKDSSVLAIKKVKLSNMDEKQIEGYANEIDLLKRLQGNPAIIQMFDSQVDLVRKAIYVVMEPGEVDLNHVLQQQSSTSRSLNMNFVRLTWQQMLSAVHCIHEERIVHADLKPANFLFVRGALKLIDFGIAKAMQSDDTTNIYRDSQIGTVNYMSPESLLDSGTGTGGGVRMKMGRASDIWSLGCILYQMVYGKTPFAELHLMQKLQAITNPNYHISFPKEGVEEAAVDAMRQCLRRDPQERPPIVGKGGLLNEHVFLNAALSCS
jgi:serine/threonine-protein kinase TTK/MPS1